MRPDPVLRRRRPSRPAPSLPGLLVLLALLVATAPAAAQSLGTCEAIEDPTVLATMGGQLAQNGAWDSAVVCFERLAERATEPAARGDALFNQGIALQSLGRHREARDVFARWMREHAGTSDDATRAEAARLFAMEASRVGTLELELPAEPAELSVRLDGRPVPVTARPLLLETDPGTHSVSVMADGHTTFTWDGRVTDGGREHVAVSLVRIETGGSVADSPGFWVGMALLVGAIAGGVVLGVYLQDDAQLDPRPGLEVIRL
jgi:hypothetical protein